MELIATPDQQHDEAPYFKRFRIIEGDSSMPESDEEGFAAIIENYGTGLKLGKHRAHGYYAIIWFPGVIQSQFASPIPDRQPRVMFELKGKCYRQLGSWIRDFLAQHDVAKKHTSMRDAMRAHCAALRAEGDLLRVKKRREAEETAARLLDPLKTLERGRRTIVSGFDGKA